MLDFQFCAMKKLTLWTWTVFFVVFVGVLMGFVFYRQGYMVKPSQSSELSAEKVLSWQQEEKMQFSEDDVVKGELKRFVVNGMSMYPLMKPWDIVTGVIFEDQKPIKRYDIVVVKFKTIDTPLIKRVIWIPGDTITFSGGKLLVNGEPENSEYIYPWGYHYVPGDIKLLQIQLKNFGGRVPDGMYLLLWDNRADSKDSRKFWLVDQKQIIGKIITY